MHDGLVEFVASHAHAAAEDDAGERNERDFRRAAADVDDHVAGGFLDRKADADGRGHGFLDEVNLARAGVSGGIFDRAFFHFGDAGGHGDDDARAHHAAAAVRFADKVGQHGLGDFEIGDDAVFERTDGDDVAGRAAEHALGLVADREDFVRAGLDGHDGGFAQDNALIADVNKGVGCAEVDADIARKETEKLSEHLDGGRWAEIAEDEWFFTAETNQQYKSWTLARVKEIAGDGDGRA